MADPCLVFLHLPKTAGSTLSTVLRWQYRHLGPQQVLRLTYRGGEEIDALRPEQRAVLRVVMGHFPFGLHEHLPMPCRYVTIVRDPIRRVISMYRYILATPRHPLHELLTSSSMSLRDYVTSDVHPDQVENALTRQLAGRQEGDGIPSEGDAETAIRNLRAFSAVGLTERFDESLIIFKRTFGWGAPFYFSRNVSDSGPHPQSVQDDVIEPIRDRNGLDLRVRDVAREIFAAQARAQGANFTREVQRFRLMNWGPRAVGGLLEPIAPRVRGALEQRAANRAPR